MVRVTIILPTYNRKAFLRENLWALRQQQFDKGQWRVIVLDNGSTDGSEKTVQEFNDINLVYDRVPVNQGYMANFNRGVAGYLDTEFVCFLCDDDLYAPYFLQMAVSGLDAKTDAGVFSLGAIYGRSAHDFNRGFSDVPRGGSSEIDLSTQLYKWSTDEWLAMHSVLAPVILPSSVFRTEVLKKLNPLLDPNVFYWDRWLLCQLGTITNCYTSPWPGSLLRMHGNNTAMSIDGQKRRDAHQHCGKLALDLCQKKGLDILEYWRSWIRNNGSFPDVIKLGIFDSYPQGLRRKIIGNWRPYNGGLERFGVPMSVRPLIRRGIALFRKLQGARWT